MHSKGWTLKKKSVCASLLALTSVAGQSGFADNWVVSHPWIISNDNTPNSSGVGELPNLFDPQDTGGLGNDGRPLKVLYQPKISPDDVIENAGTTLILNTNIIDTEGNTAIHIADSSLDGIIIDNTTVWSMQEESPLQDPSKSAIHIDSSGSEISSLTRGIYSSGNIKGGIYITGQTKPNSGSVYSAIGTSDLGGKATLEGGLSLINGGIAESLSNHTITLENHAYIDYIVSGAGSRITAKGENSSAIYVGVEGQLGGDYAFTHQIETLESVSGPSIDAATGYPSLGDMDDLILPDDESNYVKVDINNDGVGDDFDNDNKKDLYQIINTNLPTNFSPVITRDSTDTVIFIEGQLESEQSTAIKIDGTLTGQIHITPSGHLLGALDNVNNDDVPEKSVLWVRDTSTGTGAYTGTVFNEGTVNGGIFIHGVHTSPANSSLYHGLGTSTELAQLEGGYTVKYGGQATASGRGIYIDRYSSIGHVRVVGSNTNTGTASLLASTGSSAIYVANDGVIGSADSLTDPVIEISDSGEIRGDTGIVVDGRVYGSIHVDDGQLTAAANQNAVDYLNADSRLLFKQTGSNALTTGSIVGSTSHTDDKVEILGGTLNGDTLSGIDELVVSTKASINLSGDFIVPAKTTLHIEEGFMTSGPIINVAGDLAVGNTLLTIKPNSLAAYQELAANPASIVVANGGSVSGSDDNISTIVQGVPLNFVTSTGSLLRATGAILNTDTNQLEVTVAVVDPASFVDSAINQSLTDTQATLTNMAVSAMASPQSVDSTKSQELFQTLNAVNDVEALATQLMEPVDVTARSGIAAMNVTQNITLSEARDQISGFSYGDSFHWGELWGQAIYSESHQTTMSDRVGFKGKGNGYIIGAALNFTDTWLVGLSGATMTTTVNGEQDNSSKTKSYIGSIYSHWDDSRWFFDSLLTLGFNKNDTQKYVLGEKVEADYNSWLWGVKFSAGKQYVVNNLSIAPQFEFNYGRVHFDEYTSHGNSGTEKRVNASAYEVMELGGGIRTSTLSLLSQSSVRPELSIMGYYDFKKQGSQFESVYLAGGTPFIVTEAERDRFRIQGSLGISADLMEDLTINAAYNHNWSKHYTTHSFSAKADYKF